MFAPKIAILRILLWTGCGGVQVMGRPKPNATIATATLRSRRLLVSDAWRELDEGQFYTYSSWAATSPMKL